MDLLRGLTDKVTSFTLVASQFFIDLLKNSNSFLEKIYNHRCVAAIEYGDPYFNASTNLRLINEEFYVTIRYCPSSQAQAFSGGLKGRQF